MPTSASAALPRMTGDGQPVRQQQMMRGGERGRPVAAAGRVQPFGVAEHARAPGLVVRDPAAHAIAEQVGDDVDVLDEGVDGRAHGPAAVVLERLRQIPVVERHERLDAGFEQPVDEAVVEVEAGAG